MRLVLGSQSKWRRKILEEAGLSFEVMPADIDEKAIRSDDYEELPLLVARAKADALLERIDDDVVLITCDQVMVCNGKLLEKPEDEQEARVFFELYNHHPAESINAVVVTNTRTGKQAEAVDVVPIYFKQIPDNVIDQMIEKGDVFDSSGALIIEDPLFEKYIERIEGEYESVSGLPITLTKKLLEKVGYIS